MKNSFLLRGGGANIELIYSGNSSKLPEILNASRSWVLLLLKMKTLFLEETEEIETPFEFLNENTLKKKSDARNERKLNKYQESQKMEMLAVASFFKVFA